MSERTASWRDSWSPDELLLVGNSWLPLEERILDAARARALRTGQRLTMVAVHPDSLSVVARRLGGRVELSTDSEDTESAPSTWIRIASSTGLIRIFGDASVPIDCVSANVDEFSYLLSVSLDDLTESQLERRIEHETEEAERWMKRITVTRDALKARRAP